MNNDKKRAAFLLALLSDLIELGRADTLYSDLYIQRARHFLAEKLTREDYSDLKRMQTRSASLSNQIRNAMLNNDWQAVHDMSGHYRSLQEQLKDRKPLEEFARKIYEVRDTPIDPFSPGMHKLAGYSASQLPGLRADTIRRLKSLSQSDTDWKEFYLQRLAVFTNLSIATDNTNEPSYQASPDILEEEAAQALESGDIARLELLAEKLLQAPGDREIPKNVSSDPGWSRPESPDAYRYRFPETVLRRAAELGLELFRVPSRSAEFEPLCRFAWHPTYSDQQTNHANVRRIPDLPLPQGLPDALKARIQLFAVHPFINSAGVRFLPTMIAEDVLVEGFPEPEAGSTPHSSGLLEALGFKLRNQLSRQQIEAVLLDKGNDFLHDNLGLDPKEFKLICIPPDLHLRIGMERGWGQQKIWTHFDGYMIMADANRQALAGGDVRFGGIYDLLGLSRNYDSDRVIARFAVVQRRRMSLWQ